MSEEGFSGKVDLPGQSDIFESVSSVGSADGQLADATSQQEFTGLKKQISFLNDSQIEEKKYNGKIEAPIYYPRKQKPHIMLLCDQSKTKQLTGR